MWSLPLRAEARLRIFVQKMLREVLGLRKREVTGGRKKTHQKELNEFYVRSSPNVIREMKTMRERWVGLVVSIRENKNRTGF
jgi:hypothetical protein